MKEEVSLNRWEAEEVLDMMDSLEAEFGGCVPVQGQCKDHYCPGSLGCQVCEKIREFLAIEEKEE